MNSRIDIKNFILEIEQKFPVNDWKINGVHLWPILRIRLYFYLLNQVESKPAIKVESKPTIKVSNQINNYKIILYKRLITYPKIRMKKILLIWNYLKWFKLLPPKKYLFLGYDSHRVNYKGKRFNRYFDVFIDEYKLQSKAMYFECDVLFFDQQYNKELIYKFNEPYIGFLNYQKLIGKQQLIHFKSKGYDFFLDFLTQNQITKNFPIDYSKMNIEKWFVSFFSRVEFFKKVLHKIKPKKILILCYYSEDSIFALTVAANQMGIKTIEMQHGPQTEIHLAYGSWSNIPKEGYDILPREYWCWDNYSQSIIGKWAKNNPLYQVNVVGNPWIDYWAKNKSICKYSDYILYSLQPSPLTIEKLFPQVIIDFIKNKPYKWFLRLHPRQLPEMNTIKEYLKEKGILELVNIDDATNDALPLLLANAKIHLTHFSGSAIEADCLNVFSVLINETAITSFPKLITEKKAQFLDVKRETFTNELIGLLQNISISNQETIFETDGEKINLFD